MVGDRRYWIMRNRSIVRDIGDVSEDEARCAYKEYLAEGLGIVAKGGLVRAEVIAEEEKIVAAKG